MAHRSKHAGTLLGIAGVGLLLGHWLTYTLVTPGDSARQQVLASTGHGYLPFLSQVLFLVAIAAGVSFVSRALARRGGSQRASRIFPLLAAAQLLAFAVMEIGERLVAGSTLSDLSAVLPVGLLIQVAVAAIGAVMIALLTRAAADVAEGLRAVAAPQTRRGRGVATVLPSREASPSVGVAPSSTVIRGPPSR
jgi:hypothetical protein